jgi:hypothetical protein
MSDESPRVMTDPSVLDLVMAMREVQQRFHCDEISVIYQLGERTMELSLSDTSVVTFARDDGASWAVQIEDIPV